ncbi:MAG TPA: DUF4349 domain-containing protein [Clostridia bacterium]|nr:DUF4349 domain-containing protein [Clostridia bacterium]
MMDCKKALKLMPMYIDGELGGLQKQELERHLESCDSCRKEYYLEKKLIETLKNISVEELPENFNETLHDRLILQQRMADKKKNAVKKFLMVGVIAASIVFMTVFLVRVFNNTPRLTREAPSTAAEIAKGSNIYPSEGMKQSSFVLSGENGNQRGLPAGVSRKITKNVAITIEVKNANEIYDKVFNLVKEAEGFIESSEEKVFSDNTKRINLVLKVREDRFENVISQIKELGKVTALRIESKDITEQYYDLQVRLKNLEMEEKRLQEIMDKASTVKDMLEVEQELNRVRSEIESMKGLLNVWDNLTSLGTINLSITEIKGETKTPVLTSFKGMGKDIQKAFIDSINFLLISTKKIVLWIVFILPYLLLAFIGYKVYIYFKKRR